MSTQMLDELAGFFKDKDISMECHEYSAHSAAPFSRQAIRKEFKSYEAMLVILKAHMQKTVKVEKPAAPAPEPAPEPVIKRKR